MKRGSDRIGARIGWRRGARAGSGRPAAALAASLALVAFAAGASPGALTSAEELSALREAADAGTAPHAKDREQLLAEARRPWAWGQVSGEFVTTSRSGEKVCHPRIAPDAGEYLVHGAPDAYAQVLGAYLAGDLSLAQRARGNVLDLVDGYGFRGLEGDYDGSNQCVLDLAVSMPVWIETARLLEDTSVWSAADTERFQKWLVHEVYPKVAWASRVRRNNWGTAGSSAAWAIAHYVAGSGLTLREVEPKALALAPSQAAAAHADMQLRRIGGAWRGDARCSALGVQWHGGIPEELRRGATGCEGSQLVADDRSLTYQTMHVQLLVLHAEAMRAAGDDSLYRAQAPRGAPAILQAILFVIDNPAGGRSWPWKDSRSGALVAAATYYDHPALAKAAASGSTFRGGAALPYTRLTHSGIALPPPPPDGEEDDLGAPGQPSLVHNER